MGEEFGSFAAYQWSFVDSRPRQNAWTSIVQVPAHTPEAVAFSRDLKQRSFRLVGPHHLCYAHMQAVGMINDHTVDCFRWRELGGSGRGHEAWPPGNTQPERRLAPGAG